MSAMQLFYCTYLPVAFICDRYLESCIAMVILKKKPAPLKFTA